MHTSEIKSWDKQSWNDRRIYLRAFFMDGSIKQATRRELEEFLVVLANATPADSRREDDRAEMEKHAVVIRHLLQVRLGEELHWRSIWLSVLAIVISALAALGTIWQAFHHSTPHNTAPLSVPASPQLPPSK
jgi:hypothetical protein